MKRFLAVILTLLLCLGFVGCNSATEDTLYKTKSIVKNNNDSIFMAEDDDYIYFADSIIIKKMSKADNTVTTIYNTDQTSFYHVEYVDGRVYALGYDVVGYHQFKDVIISMDTDGGNVIKKDFFPLMGENSAIPNGYIYNNSLYYSYDSNTYKVNPDTLELELVDEKVTGMHITDNGDVFIRKIDDGKNKLYKMDEAGNLVLFSDESRSVWNTTNFTDYYVFYADVDLNNFTQYNLYRTDINGENKTLIKEVPLTEATRQIRYDNRYIYLLVSETELLKIDKETLKATDISSLAEQFIYCFDVFDEKLFNTHGIGAVCFDTVTGEEIIITDFGLN